MSNAALQSEAPQRKPRLALMGEFSAGKSTLSNLLIEQQPLPVRVTATRLPPVWMSHGSEEARVVGHDGHETQVALEDIATIPLDQAALIRLKLPSEALELCDLIDMPGISDPNMSASIWQNLLPEVDAVIWCTHATQAWRQSEAAVWEQISDSLTGPSTLLVTHFDKLHNTRDRERVLRRLKKETGGAFNSIFPLSLSQAIAAEEDQQAWKDSGAEAFAEHLVDTLLNWPRCIENSPKGPETVAENLVSPTSTKPEAEILRLEQKQMVHCGGNETNTHNLDQQSHKITPRRVAIAERSNGRPMREQRETQLERK